MFSMFALGASSALFVSYFSLYFLQNEDSLLEKLINERTNMYKQAKKMASIPDESQLSVIHETEALGLLDLAFGKEKQTKKSNESSTGL